MIWTENLTPSYQILPYSEVGKGDLGAPACLGMDAAPRADCWHKEKDVHPGLCCPPWNPCSYCKILQIKCGTGSYWLWNNNLRCSPPVFCRQPIQVQPSGSTCVFSQRLSREPKILIQDQQIIPNLEHHPLKVFRGCNIFFFANIAAKALSC